MENIKHLSIQEQVLKAWAFLPDVMISLIPNVPLTDSLKNFPKNVSFTLLYAEMSEPIVNELSCIYRYWFHNFCL